MTDNNIDLREKIEILKFLSAHHYQCFQDRRSFHWKMNFFMWSGITSIIFFSLNYNHDDTISYCVSIPVAIVFFYFIFFVG